jgi:hypothetical protein
MWWQYIIIVAGLAFLAYAVALIAGVETRFLTRKTDRRAEDLYSDYADTGGHRHGRRNSPRAGPADHRD